MDLHLESKVALVTGASKGIGLAITCALAKEGVRVVAGAREFDAPMLQFVDNAQVQPVAVDLSTDDGPAQLVAEAVRAFGGIDLLVNNVGAVRPRTEGFSIRHRRGLGVGAVDQLPRRRADDSRRASSLIAATGAKPEAIAGKAATESATARFTRPEEVADLVLMLASDRTGNVTGTDIVIDGGLISTM